MPGPGELRKYEDVITKDAKTSRGMLLYHKVKDRHLFEIPEKLLGRDLLWSVEISQASVGGGFNGLPLGYRVLRFERVDNRILLRSVSYQNRGLNELKAAADVVDLAPIAMSFWVETEGSERSLELRADEKMALEKEKNDNAKGAEKDQGSMPNSPSGEAFKPVDPAAAPIVSEQTSVIQDNKKIASVQPEPATLLSASKEMTKESKKVTNKEKWPVIDVTRLLQTTSGDLIDAGNMGPMGFGGVDPSRSLINQVKVFAGNVEARATLTFAAFALPQMPATQRNPSKTALVHYSLALLPDTPMQGRFADDRVGYFTQPYIEFGGERTGSRVREYITRFRLEKKNPDAAISEPVKPITFYIAEEVPAKWRKYFIEGVAAWQPVLEAAGFKNAITAKLAPTKTEDPQWDAEDARHSVIRWVALPIANAMGPSILDPRTGEVLSAHVIFWNDLLAFLGRSYFIQAGSSDQRVTQLPLSDEVMGELLRASVTHEIGHTLGLRHNNRASTAYRVKDLRNPSFMNSNGTNASIMSYGRFNSVAQPKDGVTSFVPKLGPYDFFAIEWGYKPLGKKDANDEIAELDKMAARQLTEPLLLFGGEDVAAFLDPDVLTENIGKERVESTKLSLSSLERAAARLIPATTRLGEDYDVLQETYYQLITQRAQYIGSVVKIIGGVRETRYLGGRGGDTFVRTTPKEQQAAIKFLLDDALTTPKWLTDPRVLNRISIINATGPVVDAQKYILSEMLQPIRFKVMEDAESLAPGSGMTANHYLNRVQKSVFREAAQHHPKVDIYRRELQREFIEHLKTFSGDVQKFKSLNMLISSMLTELTMDLRPAAIQGMKDLRAELTAAELRTSDKPTRLHFAQLARELDKILKIRGS